MVLQQSEGHYNYKACSLCGGHCMVSDLHQGHCMVSDLHEGHCMVSDLHQGHCMVSDLHLTFHCRA